jgi:hypothetical protein
VDGEVDGRARRDHFRAAGQSLFSLMRSNLPGLWKHAPDHARQ